MTDPDDHVKSPCVHICRMDRQRRFCTGCWRTLDEITRWGGMSSTERRSVLALLPERRRDRGRRA